MYPQAMYHPLHPVRRITTPLPDQYYYSHTTAIPISHHSTLPYREIAPKTFWEKCKLFLYYPVLLCTRTRLKTDTNDIMISV